MQRSDHPLDRVIEERGTHPDLLTEAEGVRVIEEWLILFDGLAFIVKNRPPTADPARADGWASLDHWTWPGLDLLLNLPTKAIGVTYAHLDLESAGWQWVARVRFT